MASALRCLAVVSSRASFENIASAAASIARITSAPTSADSRPLITYMPSSSGKTESVRDS